MILSLSTHFILEMRQHQKQMQERIQKLNVLFNQTKGSKIISSSFVSLQYSSLHCRTDEKDERRDESGKETSQ